MPTWTWPDSHVTRVIDGDTITARVTRDLGFHGTATFDVRLRLNRINTPPLKTQDGHGAALYVTDLLLSAAVPVLIETVAPYKFGDEWMAEVTLPSGENVSDLLVSKGYAVHWSGEGPRPGG